MYLLISNHDKRKRNSSEIVLLRPEEETFCVVSQETVMFEKVAMFFELSVEINENVIARKHFY